MQKLDNITPPSAANHMGLGAVYPDSTYSIRGDVFFELEDTTTGEKTLLERRNIVVKDASILIARLMKNKSEPSQGVFALALGTGDVGWNVMSPPAATDTQRSLYAEITRKTFMTTQFVTSGGTPVAYPTNIVDFVCKLTESEAVGPLVEMGLIGGSISSNLSIKNPVTPPNGAYNSTVDLQNFETLVNYLTFPVINKPATSTLTITWRLTF